MDLFWSQAMQEPQALVQIWLSPRTTACTTSPENGTEMASRKLDYKDVNLLRGGPYISEEHEL